MRTQEANKIPIEDYLRNRNCEEDTNRRKGSSLFFYHPNRSESHGQLQVKTDINHWWDLYAECGGTLVDLSIYLTYGISSEGSFPKHYISEALKELDQMFKYSSQTSLIPSQQSPSSTKKHPIELIEALPLNPTDKNSHILLQYLESRKICTELAQKYCSQVVYRNKGRVYYAVGVQTDKGGYHARSKHFKGFVGKSEQQGITTICNQNPCEVVSVFEGFIDCLSFLQYYKHIKGIENVEERTDLVILNSVNLRKQALDLLRQYKRINLYFDLDQEASEKMTGQKITCDLIEFLGFERCFDRSNLYQGYNDFNHFLQETL